MNDRDDLERRLEQWLTETARPMPPELLEDIVTTAPRLARSRVRAVLPSGGRWRLSIATFAAVLVFAIGLGVLLRAPVEPGASGNPTAGLSPASTKSAGPDASAEPTASPQRTPSPVPTPPADPTASAEPRDLNEWHRNNYNAGAERLVCREDISSWTCTYLIPDGSGLFSGENVTDSWVCPAWFPGATCDDVTAVYRGAFTLTTPLGQTPEPGSTVTQEYVVTDVGGQAVLQLYWVDQFVCPWYRTLDEALNSPFECTFAPGVTPPG